MAARGPRLKTVVQYIREHAQIIACICPYSSLEGLSCYLPSPSGKGTQMPRQKQTFHLPDPSFPPLYVTIVRALYPAGGPGRDIYIDPKARFHVVVKANSLVKQ